MISLEVPVELSREAARRAAEVELRDSAYAAAQPGLIQRIVTAITDAWERLLSAAGDASPAGLLVWLLLAVILAVVLAVILVRTGGVARTTTSRATPLFGGSNMSAVAHRDAATAFADSGRWAEALRELLRAVVRNLEERAILEPWPGRTADELATEVAIVLPARAQDLRRAVRLFDDVWYGGRDATPAMYDELRGIESRVRVERPAPISVGAGTRASSGGAR